MLMGALRRSCLSAVRSVLLLTSVPPYRVVPDLAPDLRVRVGPYPEICRSLLVIYRTERPLALIKLRVRVGNVLGVSRLVLGSR